MSKTRKLFVLFLSIIFIRSGLAFAAVPSAITNLTASSLSGAVELNWTAPSASPAISDYDISYRVVGSTTWTTFSDGVSTTASATVTGLTNNTDYQFRVRAVNSDGTAADSNIAETIPLGLTFSDNIDSLTVGNINGQNGWVQAGTSVYSVIDNSGNKAVRGDGTGECFHTNNVLQPISGGYGNARLKFDFKHISDGTATPQLWVRRQGSSAGDPGSYMFYRTTTNIVYIQEQPTSGGCGIYSRANSSGPIALTAGSWYTAEFETITLANGNILLNGYMYPQGGTRGAPLATYTETASPLFSSGGSFAFGRFSSVQTEYDNFYFYSDAIQATPSAPRSLAGPGGADGQVALSWTAPLYTGTTSITDYSVEYSLYGQDSWSIFSDGVSTSTSATVTGLTNGTAYDFRVRAINTGGSGSPAILSNVTPLTPTIPTVSSVSFTGTLRYPLVLTGQGTFSDVNGDSEGISTYRWLRSDTLNGTYTAIPGATSLTYTLTTSDINKYIKFEYTPVSVNAPTTGESVLSSGQGPILNGNMPTVSGVSFTGTLREGSTLTGQGTFSDPDGDSQGTSTYRWFRSGSSSGIYNVIEGATSITYVLTASDVGQYIRFEYKPVSAVEPAIGTPQLSASRGPIEGTQVPYATNVSFSGSLRLGETLSGIRTYNDPNGDAQGISTYRWLRSDTLNGTYTAIPGATSLTYTLTTSDINKYIKFEYTPVSVNAPTTGLAVASSGQGPVFGEEYWHILLTGQSLSTGYGSTPALSTSQEYENIMPESGLEGLDIVHDYIYESGAGQNGNVETPASGIANTISGDHDGVRLAMSINGSNGLAYSSLKKGTSLYNKGITQATDFNTAVASDWGSTYIPKAVVAYHGESDYLAGLSSSYEANLVEWQNDYKTDLNAIGGGSEDIPLFITQMNSVSTGTIGDAQLAAHKNNPGKIILVGPKYQLDYNSDAVHLTNTSSRISGELVGKVINKVLIEGETWNPLMPTSINRFDKEIEITFNIPVAPLVIDTTNVAARTNYGFEFAQTGGNTVTITNVRLIDGNSKIRVTLSDIPTGSNQKLRYAWTCPIVSTWCADGPNSSRVGGNIRDSDSYVSSASDSSGATLYNWLVSFNEPITVPTLTPSVSSNAGVVPIPEFNITNGASLINKSKPSLNRSLFLGMRGDDVLVLQKFLNSKGFTISSSGFGSPSRETTYFGVATSEAVKKFQKFYGIKPINGRVGPITRSKINTLLQNN